MLRILQTSLRSLVLDWLYAVVGSGTAASYLPFATTIYLVLSFGSPRSPATTCHRVTFARVTYRRTHHYALPYCLLHTPPPTGCYVHIHTPHYRYTCLLRHSLPTYVCFGIFVLPSFHWITIDLCSSPLPACGRTRYRTCRRRYCLPGSVLPRLRLHTTILPTTTTTTFSAVHRHLHALVHLHTCTLLPHVHIFGSSRHYHHPHLLRSTVHYVPARAAAPPLR